MREAEVAGGKALVDGQAILDIKPTSLHQRVGLAIGPRDDVEMIDSISQTEL